MLKKTLDALGRLVGINGSPADSVQALEEVVDAVNGVASGGSDFDTREQHSDFISGLVDPYDPDNFAAPSVIVQTVSSTAGAEIRCLPAGNPGDIIVLVHGGDGGSSTGQTGPLRVIHMHPDYDASADPPGDDTEFHGIYLPYQKSWTMLPADAMILRRDEGHVSWRAIAMTHGVKVDYCVPSQFALGGNEGVYSADLDPDVTDNFDPGDDAEPLGRMLLGGDAAGSSIGGLRPPANNYYDTGAGEHRAFGGTLRIIFNKGPGTLTLINLHPSANAGWQFLSSGNHVLAAFESRLIAYENFGTKYWLILGKA